MNENLMKEIRGIMDSYIVNAKKVAKKLYGVDADFRWQLSGYSAVSDEAEISVYTNDYLLMNLYINGTGCWWCKFNIGGKKEVVTIYKRNSRIFYNRSDIPYIIAHLFILNYIILPELENYPAFCVKRYYSSKNTIKFEINHSLTKSFSLLIFFPKKKKKILWLLLVLGNNIYSIYPKGDDIHTIAKLIKEIIASIVL